MRNIKSIVKDVAEIYQESGNEAEEYLCKARQLKEKFGSGLAVVYCWFYSVPQKWTQVEPKVFDLMKYTSSFGLDTVLSMTPEKMIAILKPMIFYNEVSRQLHNFCKAVKNEYSSWDHFADALSKENIFETYKKLRKHRNSRVTFKNLSAMKIIVGREDHLIILDTHVAKVLGIEKNEISKYRVQEPLFKKLLELSENITQKLGAKGFEDISPVKWSLAIWFKKAKILADQLLNF